MMMQEKVISKKARYALIGILLVIAAVWGSLYVSADTGDYSVDLSWVSTPGNVVENGDSLIWKPSAVSNGVFTYRVRFSNHEAKEYEAGDIRIELPESLYDYRYIEEIKGSYANGGTARFSDMSLQQAPDMPLGKMPFHYSVEDGKIVVTNAAAITGSINASFQVSYSLNPTRTVDGTAAAITGDVTVAGQKTKTNTLNLQVETANRVTAAATKPVRQMYKWENKYGEQPENFSDYWFYWFSVSGSGAGVQPYTLQVMDTPEKDTELVGIYDSYTNAQPKRLDEDTPGLLDAGYHAGNKSSAAYALVKVAKSAGNKFENVVNAQVTGIDDKTEKNREASQTAEAADFSFHYTGDIYSIRKTADSGDNMGITALEVGSDWKTTWNITGAARHYEQGSDPFLYRLEVVDDLLYGKAAGASVLLGAADYYYESVTVKAENYYVDEAYGEERMRDPGEIEDLEVYAKTAGQNEAADEWQLAGEIAWHESGINSTVTLPPGTYQVKAVQKDAVNRLEITLTPRITLKSDSPAIKALIAEGSEEITIRNFTSLLAYDAEGKLHNIANDSNYNGFVAEVRDEIISYDQNIYGDYVQRATALYHMGTAQAQNYINKTARSTYDESLEQVDITYTIEALEYLGGGSGSGVRDAFRELLEMGAFEPRNEAVIYDLLPLGVAFREVLGVGTAQSSSYYFYDAQVDVETIPDFQGSGRTMVIFRIRHTGVETGEEDNVNIGSFNDINSNTIIRNAMYSAFRIQFSCVAADSSINTATDGVNHAAYQTETAVLGEAYADDGTDAPAAVRHLFENLAGKPAVDTELKNTLYTEAQTDLNLRKNTVSGPYKEVRHADLDDFGQSAIVGPGQSYVYRLTAYNLSYMRDLIMYDRLDEGSSAGVGSWRGTFESIEMNPSILALGVKPVVYYSVNPNAVFDLADTGSGWTKEEPADKGAIKAIAVDFSKDTNGNPITFAPSEHPNFQVTMKAPEVVDEAVPNAYNDFSITMSYSEEADGVYQQTNNISNETIVNLRDKIKVSYEWFPGVYPSDVQPPEDDYIGVGELYTAKDQEATDENYVWLGFYGQTGGGMVGNGFELNSWRWGNDFTAGITSKRLYDDIVLYGGWLEGVWVSYEWISTDNPQDVEPPQPHLVAKYRNAAVMPQEATSESGFYFTSYGDNLRESPLLTGNVLTQWNNAPILEQGNPTTFTLYSVSQDTTLYARWVYPVRVYYEWVGDHQPESVSPPSHPYEVGEYTFTPTLRGDIYDSLAQDTAGVEDMMFNGWYVDEELTTRYTEGSVLTEDVMYLYGEWTPVTDSVKVEYKWIGSGPSDVNPPSAEIWERNLAYFSQKQEESAQNYNFDGWYLDAELTQKYMEGTELTEDVTTLYGAWTSSITVSYEWVGDDIPTDVVPPESDKIAPGSAYSSKEQEDTNQDYLFDGWYTQAQLQSKFIDETVLNASTILYGRWRPITEPDKSVSSDSDAGQNSSIVQVGDQITYEITYENYTADTANVVITDQLDAGLDFVAAYDESGIEVDPETAYDAGRHTVAWTIQNVAPDRSGSVKLTVAVNEKAGEMVENQAGVKVGSQSRQYTPIVENPVSPDDPQDPVKTYDTDSQVGQDDAYQIGDYITYEISYYNHERSPVQVVIADQLDDGLDFVSAEPSGSAVYDAGTHQVTWTLKEVAAVSSGKVSLTVQVNEKAVARVDNKASVQIGDHVSVDTNTLTNEKEPDPEYHYWIMYYYDGRLDKALTEDGVALEGEVIDTYPDKVKEGYVFERADQFPLTVTANEADNEIHVYYVKEKLEYSYRISYYYDGIRDDDLTEVGRGREGTVIDRYTDHLKEGYKFDHATPESFEISSDESQNEMHVYYVSENPEYHYWIMYYYDGVLDESLTESGTTRAGTVIDSYTDNLKEGYKFDHVTPQKLNISSDEGENEMHVYYVSELEVPKPETYRYWIRYYYDGVMDEAAEESESAKPGTVIREYPDKIKDGFLFDHVEPAELLVTDDEGENEMHVYYVSKPKEYRYWTYYYYDGILDEDATEADRAQEGDRITAYKDKIKEGFKLEKVEPETLTVSSDESRNERDIYYVSEQKEPDPEPYRYWISYYYDGILDEDATEERTARPGTYIDDYPDKNRTGYRLDYVDPIPLVVTEDEGKNEMHVYYVSVTYRYWIKYYYDGIQDEEATEVREGRFGEIISRYPGKDKAGYVFEKALPRMLMISNIESQNEMHIYYVSQTPAPEPEEYRYWIYYYYDGILAEEETEVERGQKGEVVHDYPDKPRFGYKLVNADPLPLTVSNDESQNEIHVYYEPDMYRYWIKYYYDGILDDEATEVREAQLGQLITRYPGKDREGYRFRSAYPQALPISETESDNVLHIYYVSDGTQTPEPEEYRYWVYYYYDGILDESATELGREAKGEIIEDFLDKNRAGYYFKTAEGVPLTISSDESENEIHVYYEPDDYRYWVKYYYDGILDDEATRTEGSFMGELVTRFPVNDKEGYTFQLTASTRFLAVGADESKNRANIYYVSADTENPNPEPREYRYWTYYYYDGVMDEDLTETAKVQPGDEIVDYPDKRKEGYTFEGAYVFEDDTPGPLPLTVSKDEGQNEIHVHYVSEPDNNEYRYWIMYYYNGRLDESLTEERYAEEGTRISTYPDKRKSGYRFDKVDPKTLTVATDEGENEMHVYYVSEEPDPDPGAYKYWIKYYYDGVLDESLTETGSGREGQEVSDYPDKAKEGYLFEGADPEILTISSDEGENEMHVYYVSEPYRYWIMYYYDGILDETLTEMGSAVAGKIISQYPDKIKEGYQLEKVRPGRITVSADEGENVLHVYYISQTPQPEPEEYRYWIYYYYDGIQDESETEVGRAEAGQEINSYPDKIRDGYKLVKAEPLPLQISKDEGENEIHVYYERQRYRYWIRYYYDGVLDEDATEIGEAAIWELITRYPGKDKEGYQFQYADPAMIAITEDESTNEMNLYYVSDGSQTPDPEPREYRYWIYYYYDGVLDEDLTEVNNAMPDDEITSYPDKVKDGYIFDHATDLPLMITNDESQNEIHVHYVSEEPEIEKYRYWIMYYYDGILDEKLTEERIAEENVRITSYPDKNKAGYRFERVSPKVLTVSSDEGLNEMHVYYVSNDPQTPDPGDQEYRYWIYYYYDGILDESEKEIGRGRAGDEVDSYPDKIREGYRLVKAEPLPLEISKDEGENEIHVYYEKQKYRYWVRYYYDGVLDEEATVIGEAPVWEIISRYPGKDKEGYRFQSVYPPFLYITPDESQNEMNLYYVSDGSLKPKEYRYRTYYYYDGILDDDLTETGIGLPGDEISGYKDKWKEGYIFDHATDLPLILTEDESQNEIHVYYVSDEAEVQTYHYWIRYYYNGIQDPDLIETRIAEEGAKISTYPDKPKEGFTFSHVDPNVLLVTSDEGQNEMHVYYISDQERPDPDPEGYRYWIKYYYDGKIDNSATESDTGREGDRITTYPDKPKEGYVFEKAEPEELMISSDEGKNEIHVYYVSEEDTPDPTPEPDEYEYRIKYYYDGDPAPEEMETGRGKEGQKITEYPDKSREGYVFEKAEPEELIISRDEEANEIHVYYVTESKTPDPGKEYMYRIKYYYDGKLDPDATESGSGEEGEKISHYPDKPREGYVFEKAEPEELTISSDEGQNEIRVYYVSEQNGSDKYRYWILYYYDGRLDESVTETGSADVGEVISEYPDKVKDGYRFDRADDFPLEISDDEGHNEIHVHYVSIPVDPEPADYHYWIMYYYDGVKDDSATETGTAEEGTVISSYPDKNREGYHFERVSPPSLTISSDEGENEMHVYYVSDEPDPGSEPDQYRYWIMYYYDGILDPSLTETRSAEPGAVISDYPNKDKGTYVFEKAVPGTLTVTSDEGENEMHIYYVSVPAEPEPEQYRYWISYYYDGHLDKELTEAGSAAAGTVISEYPDKGKEGYQFDRAEPEALTVQPDESKNEMHIYYVSEEPQTPDPGDQEYRYWIQYYFDEVLDEDLTEMGSGKVGDVISEYPDKLREGYEFDRANPETLTISNDEGKNEIHVYYVSQTTDPGNPDPGGPDPNPGDPDPNPGDPDPDPNPGDPDPDPNPGDPDPDPNPGDPDPDETKPDETKPDDSNPEDTDQTDQSDKKSGSGNKGSGSGSDKSGSKKASGTKKAVETGDDGYGIYLAGMFLSILALSGVLTAKKAGKR